MSGFFKSLRFDDGSPWTGRTKQNETRTLVVKEPATVEDRVDFYSIEGNYSLYAGRLQEAIGHFQELIRLRPELWHPHTALGAAYLRLNRFNEAATEFERAFPQWLQYGDRRGQVIAIDLARAYVALGSDADAGRVMRAAGIPENEIPERLDRMKRK